LVFFLVALIFFGWIIGPLELPPRKQTPRTCNCNCGGGSMVFPWWYDGGAMVVPHNAFHQQSEQLPACPVHCQCAWWLWWPDALPWLRHTLDFAQPPRFFF